MQDGLRIIVSKSSVLTNKANEHHDKASWDH